MNTQKRNIEWIDALKVVTMLLVIIGHCTYLSISTSYGGTPYANCQFEGEQSWTAKALLVLSTFIYSFHMPLFMSISGMCLRLSLGKNPTWGQFVRKKGKRLLVPFLCVTFLYAVPIKYLSGYYALSTNITKDILLGQVLLLGNSHLWYVMSLFEIFLAYYLVERRKVKKGVTFWVVLMLVSWIGKYLEGHFNILGLGAAMKHLLFFAIGYNVFPWLSKVNIPNIKKPVLGLFITFLLSGINIASSHLGVAGKSLNYMLLPVAALIGGGSTTLIIKHLCNKIQAFPFYTLFKRNTYGLYLYSDPLNYPLIYCAYMKSGTSIYIENISYISLFVLRFLGTTLGAFAVIFILGKIKGFLRRYTCLDSYRQ